MMSTLLLTVLLMAAPPVTLDKHQPPERGGSEHPQREAIIKGARGLDVHALDDSLAHEAFEHYLARVVPGNMQITWSTSDCDLMPSFPRAATHPLCVSVRGRRGYTEFRCEIQVGSHGKGLDGVPIIRVLWLAWYKDDNPEEPLETRAIGYLADLSGAFEKLP